MPSSGTSTTAWRFPLDVSGWLDIDEHSDVTIKFGNEEMKCHKIVFCARSEYFQRMLTPQSGFSEHYHDHITLQEDDPKALHAVIRWMYTCEYEDVASSLADDPFFHLHVYQVADKYLLDRLASYAKARFMWLAEKSEDMNVVAAIIETLRKPEHATNNFIRTANELERRHMSNLVDHEPYFEALLSDPERVRALIKEELTALQLIGRAKRFHKCKDCSVDAWDRSGHVICVACKRQKARDEKFQMFKYWTE